MASRQGGPGRDELPGTRTDESVVDDGVADGDGVAADRAHSPSNAASPDSGPQPNRRTASELDLPVDPRRQRAAATSPAERRTPEDPPVRDPGLYALTDHFYERLGQAGRYVTTTAVSNAIREGQLRWNTTDGWRFALVEDGIRFVVVVGDTHTQSPVVVTAWTEVADRDAALEAARWDGVDIDTIAIRAALSEHAADRIPDRIRPRDVSRPFEIGHHRVTTAPGEADLRCADCGGLFRSKDDLTTRYCR